MTTHWLDNDTWMVEAIADTGEFAVFLSDQSVEISLPGREAAAVDVPAGLEPALAAVSQSEGRIRILIPRRKAA